MSCHSWSHTVDRPVLLTSGFLAVHNHVWVSTFTNIVLTSFLFSSQLLPRPFISLRFAGNIYIPHQHLHGFLKTISHHHRKHNISTLVKSNMLQRAWVRQDIWGKIKGFQCLNILKKILLKILFFRNACLTLAVQTWVCMQTWTPQTTTKSFSILLQKKYSVYIYGTPLCFSSCEGIMMSVKAWIHSGLSCSLKSWETDAQHLVRTWQESCD